MSGQTGYFLNKTWDYNSAVVTMTSDAGSRSLFINDHGLLVSTSSDCKVYGVRSDRGTTDGFLALPLTTDSTRFFVAAWPSVLHLRQSLNDNDKRLGFTAKADQPELVAIIF